MTEFPAVVSHNVIELHCRCPAPDIMSSFRSPSHILYDARKVRDYGIGTYIRSLARELGKRSDGLEYAALTLRSSVSDGLLPGTWTTFPVGHRQYSAGELFQLGAAIRRIGPDLYHATHYAIPLRPGVPTVTTIHDIIHLLFPDIFNVAKRVYASRMVSHALRTSRIIITDAEVTRVALLDRFKIDPQKVVSIHLGVDPVYFAGAQRQKHADAFRAAYKIEGPYLLFVSNPKKHKGIDILLKAYRILRHRFDGLRLVVIGGSPEDADGIRRSLASPDTAAGVDVLGHVPEEHILGAYCGAEVLVHPSLYEGFGLVVLEAMATGTPVVCSDGGSLPEVAGDGALIVPAGDADALAVAVESMLSDSSTHARFVAAGMKRASQFTWERTAELTVQCYRRALGQ